MDVCMCRIQLIYCYYITFLYIYQQSFPYPDLTDLQAQGQHGMAIAARFAGPVRLYLIFWLTEGLSAFSIQQHFGSQCCSEPFSQPKNLSLVWSYEAGTHVCDLCACLGLQA
jgi:hypothetical protein